MEESQTPPAEESPTEEESSEQPAEGADEPIQGNGDQDTDDEPAED